MIHKTLGGVCRFVGLVVVVAAWVVASSSAAHAGPGLTDVNLTLVEENISFRATFQSHNQKIAQTPSGDIFMVFVRHEANGAWRLWRSIDGGATWTVVYDNDATHRSPGVSPVLETDENGNIYLCLNNQYAPGTIFFYRFLASENYTTAHITSQSNSGGYGKFAMEYDQPRQQFYFVGQYGVDNQTYFQKINKDGTFNGARTKLTVAGTGGAGGSYPCLCLRDGVLHLMYTNGSIATGQYYDIHHVQTPDGGATWQKFDGTAVSVPWVCDTDATDRITTGGDADYSVFGSNMLIRGSKAYFMYPRYADSSQHFARYHIPTGVRDVDIEPTWSGGQIRIYHLDGYLCARSAAPITTLYAISSLAGEEKVNCLASDNDGATWYDYAQSARMPIDPANPGLFTAYAKSGCPEITSDNYIIGHVTANDAPTGSVNDQSSKVYFLKIKAGLSRANMTAAERHGQTLSFTFAGMRGQPEQIRFLPKSSQAWTEWQAFSTHVDLELIQAAVQYQLKSRLGVESEVFDVPLSMQIESPPVVTGVNYCWMLY